MGSVVAGHGDRDADPDGGGSDDPGQRRPPVEVPAMSGRLGQQRRRGGHLCWPEPWRRLPAPLGSHGRRCGCSDRRRQRRRTVHRGRERAGRRGQPDASLLDGAAHLLDHVAGRVGGHLVLTHPALRAVGAAATHQRARIRRIASRCSGERPASRAPTTVREYCHAVSACRCRARPRRTRRGRRSDEPNSSPCTPAASARGPGTNGRPPAASPARRRNLRLLVALATSFHAPAIRVAGRAACVAASCAGP